MSTPPDDNAPRWVILFDSIHHVLAAERVFQERGIWCDLVPVPRDLGSDCGMVVQFRRADLDAARSVLADPRVMWRSVWQPCPDGYEDVTMTPRERESADE